MGQIDRNAKTKPPPPRRSKPPEAENAAPRRRSERPTMPAPADPTVSATRLRVRPLSPPPLLDEPLDQPEGPRASAPRVKVGALRGIPVLAMSPEAILSRQLDHRAGFLLSRVDGESSVEALLDLVPLPRPEALRILAELVGQGILRVEKPSR